MALFRRKSEQIISPTAPSSAQATGWSAPGRDVDMMYSGAAAPLQQAPAPTPAGGPPPAFSMTVEDVFSITGRGTVVTGTIDVGTLQVGDIVAITPAVGAATAQVAGIEQFRRRLDQAQAGDMVGVLLDGVARSDVAAGTVLTSPPRL